MKLSLSNWDLPRGKILRAFSMRPPMKQIALLLALLGTLASAPIAHAGPKEQARKHYDRGVELFDDGQLEGAMIEFQRAYDLTHHYAVLYNLGQVLASLAKPLEAEEAYSRDLTEGGKRIPEARRTEVELELARQKARIATLEIRGLPEGAAVLLDGKEIGKAPLPRPIRVAMGTHTVAGSADGYSPVKRQVTVAGEDRRVVELVLEKRAEPAAHPDPEPPPGLAIPSEAPAPGKRLRVLGIVSGAVGMASIGTAIYFYTRAVSLSEKVSNSGAPKDSSDYRAGERAETMQWVFYSVGAGALVTGLVLYLVGTPSSPQPSQPAEDASGVTPMLGVGLVGLSARGTF